MIEKIIANGYGYAAADGSVYFSVEAVDNYGRLTGQKLEDMQAGARIDVNEAKRNPYDFALWKAAKPGEVLGESGAQAVLAGILNARRCVPNT